MKILETINSRSWAREARRRCRIRRYKYRRGYSSGYIHAWTHTIEGLGWIQARPCYVWGRSNEDGRRERFPVLTGGWVVKVRPHDPEQMKTRPATKVFRIAGPVSLDKLSLAMARAERYLRTERQLIATRETLKRLVDTKDVPANIDRLCRRVGLPMIYADMTPEHCQAWAEIAKAWPNKTVY